MRRLLAVNATGLVGGAEISLLRTLRAAGAHGWTTTVLSPDGPLTDRLAAVGIPRVVVPNCKLGDGPRFVAACTMTGRWLRAARVVRQRAAGADVVVANGILALAPVVLARSDAPIVWLVHDVVARRDWRVITRAFSARVRVAVVPSRAVARSLEGLGLKDVRVVPHGTPWPVDAAPSAPRDRAVIGLVGNLVGHKGQDVLLDAVARLSRRDVIVELVGTTFPKDASFAHDLRARARRPDLAGRVRFLDWLSDVPALMRGWTVAVSASVEPEAFGLAIVEAMSLGVAVVATDHGGTSETVGGAGVLVPPGDVGALAAELEHLLDCEVERARIAAAGRERVAERYTLGREEDALVEILTEVPRRPPIVVTWVVPDLVEGLGGTSRRTINIGRELVDRGHTVGVVARRRGRALARRDVVDGLPVVRVGLPGSGRIVEKLGILSVAWQLARRRDGVVQVVMYPDFAVAAALVGRGRRTVMSWAGLGDATDTIGVAHAAFRSIQRRMRRAALSQATNVVLTAAMAREVGGLGLSVMVVPVPVDRDVFRPPAANERADARRALGVSPDEAVVVSVGQLRRLKALDRLIDAFAMLRTEGRSGRLVLVGGASSTAGSCELELRAHVEDAGLRDYVTFTGMVDDVRPYLWAADVFVLASEREGMPNSLVEAMACGVACVAPAEPVGAEILGNAGVVTDDNSPAALLEALRTLADDPIMRSRLGAAASTASEAWSLGAVVDRYEELYERVMRGSR